MLMNLASNELIPMLIFVDWKHLDENVGSVLLKWIYTDVVSQDQLTIDLMKAASGFALTELVYRCEKYLIGSVKLQDCVRLYTIAEELGAKKLRDHCSSLISCHWVSVFFFFFITFYLQLI